MSVTYVARHAKPYDREADIARIKVFEIKEMTIVEETGTCQMEDLGVEHSGIGTLRVNAYNLALHSDDSLNYICDNCDTELKRLVATDGE